MFTIFQFVIYTLSHTFIQRLSLQKNFLRFETFLAAKSCKATVLYLSSAALSHRFSILNTMQSTDRRVQDYSERAWECFCIQILVCVNVQTSINLSSTSLLNIVFPLANRFNQLCLILRVRTVYISV